MRPTSWHGLAGWLAICLLTACTSTPTEILLPVESSIDFAPYRNGRLQLAYEFTTVNLNAIPTDLTTLPKQGAQLTLALLPDSSRPGLHKLAGLYQQLPTSAKSNAVTLQAIVVAVFPGTGNIRLGTLLESYPCSPDTAARWKQDLVAAQLPFSRVAARIRIDSPTKATLVGLQSVEPPPTNPQP